MDTEETYKAEYFHMDECSVIYHGLGKKKSLNILHNLLKNYPVLNLCQHCSEIYNSKVMERKQGFRFDCLSNQSQDIGVKKEKEKNRR